MANNKHRRHLHTLPHWLTQFACHSWQLISCKLQCSLVNLKVDCQVYKKKSANLTATFLEIRAGQHDNVIWYLRG